MSSDKIISVYADDQESSEQNDLFQKRHEVCEFIKEKTEVTIVVIAYNRPEVTRLCIESLLKYTNGINYKLALVYNDNPGNEDILEYFNTVEYQNKVVMHISRNAGAAFAYQQIMKYVEGKYIVHLPNDVIVTPNWLNNLIKCAESDIRIGMVNPVSSNVSNLQQVNLKFNNYEEMQDEARKFNISDPKKWSERLRLITLATLFKRECLSIVGDIFDPGFAHNFGDDDITFRVRRAGYKAILAEDTWVHHDHKRDNMSYEDAEKYNENLMIGRNHFREKYYGIDAWDDVNNFIPEILPHIRKPDNDKCTVLGIDVRCGTPILEIKNQLRKQDVFDTECCAATFEGKYFIDLQTICGADNVVTCSAVEVSDNFPPKAFDYIIIGENINGYSEPYKVIKNAYSLLKKGGNLYFYLKNTYDIYQFLNVIGNRDVRPEKFAYNIPVETFIEDLNTMRINSEIIGVVPYYNLPVEFIQEINNKIDILKKDKWEETSARLTMDKIIVKLSL